MGQQLAILEPIKAPDVRRPATMQSLPEWVESRLASISEESQKNEAGIYQPTTTLPAQMLPTQSERHAIQQHLRDLRPLLDLTPIATATMEAATLVLVTKLMFALPAQRSSENGAEAVGDAYMAALDDVPTWAVEAAIRGWYRGESLKFAREPHDFRWRPAPATLRTLANIEAHRVRGRVIALEKLLAAQERVEFTEEECADNLNRLSKVLHEVVAKNSMNGKRHDEPATESEGIEF